MSQRIILDMDTERVMLFMQIQGRHMDPNSPVERNADMAARFILRGQHDDPPTIDRIVNDIERDPARKSGDVTAFNREAWIELVEAVVVALKSDDPTRALEDVHVSTAPH